MSSYTHLDLDHQVSSLSVISNVRDNNLLSDVTLLVGNIGTKAHRSVLASTSQYFDAMFNGEMCEKTKSAIHLHGLDPGDLQLLVEYAYSSRVTITEKNVQSLLSSASFLQFDSVRNACSMFMIKHLSLTNCLKAWQLGETYTCNELSIQARSCVLRNFETVAKCKEFCDLSFSEIVNLISEDKLWVLSENEVYKAVIRWIKYDPAERSQYSAQLFEHVRFTQLSKDFLFDVVNKEPLVCDEPGSYKMLLDTIIYHECPEQRSDLPLKRTVRRLGGLSVFAIGGTPVPYFDNSAECYDFVNDRWLPIEPMIQPRADAGIAALDGLIYATGGYAYTDIYLSSAECYDPISDEWSPISSMNSSRFEHGINALDGLLYVCGGTNGISTMSNVERYDPHTDVWSTVPSMITPRMGCRVGVVNNCLYAIGGHQYVPKIEQFSLFSVERYDPRMSKWMAVADLNVMRYAPAVDTLDDTLYCVGGTTFISDTPESLSCGERLDVRRNAWEPIANMCRSRSCHGMVAANGELLVLGGCGSNSTERYNPRNDQWTLATPMRINRNRLGAALLYSIYR